MNTKNGDQSPFSGALIVIKNLRKKTCIHNSFHDFSDTDCEF